MADADFAKGATVGPGYDTTPGGLGLSPAYLGGATATASLSASSTSGTTFPAAPADGQEYVYVADSTNGVFWRFRWYAASSYWAFIGGPPLYNEILTSEATTSASYVDLGTVGPSIALPFAGDYDVTIGADVRLSAAERAQMSYQIGGTGAVDADSIENTFGAVTTIAGVSLMRSRRKSGLTAVTLTAKYKTQNGTSSSFLNRFMRVVPVKK